MKYSFLFFLYLFLSSQVFAHSTIKGRVYNAQKNEPIFGVLVQVQGVNKQTQSDANGSFELKGLTSGTYTLDFSILGFKRQTKTVQIKENESVVISVPLEESPILISEILITPRQEVGLSTISSIDFNLRPVKTTQDLLRLVPGLFIAQHAGGGKAEQLFLRGFDVDHGTDVAISVDGLPVNMVSHAHGQGYADLHFVIPETIDRLDFSKGPYDAKTGDFNTAGAVRFHTKRSLDKSLIKLEGGSYNAFRGVALLDLLGNEVDSLSSKHHAYVASEYALSKGFFESSQNFNRLNVFGKYSGSLTNTADLSVSVSAFSSSWDASGQIPERAVASGRISRFGAIDNTEGGSTSRYNANLVLAQTLPDESIICNQLYYSHYRFNLFSNFTFFKEDTLNGDQINQFENRNIFGYNGSFSKNSIVGTLGIRTEAGIGLRNDRINNIGLTHTRRRKFLNDIRRGNIDELNAHAYLEETFFLTPKWTINAGARLDHFRFQYTNALTDSLAQVVNKTIVSPKLNVYYTVAKQVQLYASAGSGFHSNDARVAATNAGVNTVPKGYGADIAANF